jgi:protein-disulfide isomerase
MMGQVNMRSNSLTGTLVVATAIVPAIVGLVASSILAVDYLRPAPVFCAEGGGCDAVRHTAFAAPLGIPMPFVGMAGFLVIGVSGLFQGSKARWAQVSAAGIAALVGVVLLAAQVVLRRLCPYCCISDASGIASAPAAVWALLRGREASSPRLLRGVAALSLPVAVVTPIAIGWNKPPIPPVVPSVIAAEIARTPKGQVTIVDFVDFECPFCRRLNAELQPLLTQYGPRIRLVRRQVPLASHPHAADAARAACCAEILGKGDAMADALFSTPVEELTASGCERVAQELGLPMTAYRACVADPRTTERIETDHAEFRAAGGYALPTLWIEGVQLVGAQPEGVLEATLKSALAGFGPDRSPGSP